MLRRAGYAYGDIAIFTEAAARAGKDPNIKDKLRTARDAAEGFDVGKKTEGLPTLEKKFGQDISRAIVEWLGLGRGQASAAATATGDRTAAANPARTEPDGGCCRDGTDNHRRRPACLWPGYPYRPPEDHRRRRHTLGRADPCRRADDAVADGYGHRLQEIDGRAKGFVQCKPPIDVAEIVLDRAELLPVNGMILAASMRPDGSLITQPGYDRATGLYLVDPPAMPAVPDRPDGAAAMKALALFERLLKDFTFTDDHSKAVALSALITPIVRPALGRVPLHAVTARTAAAASPTWSILLQRSPPARRRPRSPPAVIWVKWKSGLMWHSGRGADRHAGQCHLDPSRRLLCAFIEQPKVKVRLLGHSKAVDIVPLCTPFVTGINLQISGDLIRRTLRCSIDPKQENAWEREFSGNPVDTVLAIAANTSPLH